MRISIWGSCLVFVTAHKMPVSRRNENTEPYGLHDAMCPGFVVVDVVSKMHLEYRGLISPTFNDLS